MVWKKAARLVLHKLGGAAALRWRHRTQFRILMFHHFSADSAANTETLCSHIASDFQPVSLPQIVRALEGGPGLPENAVAITVDDGHKDFLQYGYPILRKYRLPATVYIVSGFADGRLWLWFDQVKFALEQTPESVLRAELDGKVFEFHLSSVPARTAAAATLIEALKVVQNHERLGFLSRLMSLCRVEIPPQPPMRWAAMSWDDLRGLAAEGVEIGCHTETHPILSRVTESDRLDHEIGGAKAAMEARLGFPVRHFCYPNGRDIDIGAAAAQKVRAAGFASAVTTTWGLNSVPCDPMTLRRVPFDSTLDPRYGTELLVGLHM